MNSGWIKLYRKSMDHWLYNENRAHTKREAWEDILLLCNHDDNKSLLNGEIIECKRGQSVMSLKSWANTFKWSIQQVRTFFKLLENDSMINTEGLKYSTRITVCNYDTYQGNQQTDNRLITDLKQTDNKLLTTNKKDKEVKEDIISVFDEFRKVYPGTKRGLKVEFADFKKKVPNSELEEIVKKLLPALNAERIYHKLLESSNKLIPQWKNLKTWINQECWTQEFSEITVNPTNGHPILRNESGPQLPQPKGVMQ